MQGPHEAPAFAISRQDTGMWTSHDAHKPGAGLTNMRGPHQPPTPLSLTRERRGHIH